MNIDKIKEFLFENNEPLYRVNQIEKAVFIDYKKSFLDINQIPISLREKLNEGFDILSFNVLKLLKSQDNATIKALLELKDKKRIETVLIPKNKGEFSVCVSTQVGCPIKCVFCLSGKNGLKRNLNDEEISDQVLFWKQYVKENNLGEVSSVVYMGSGEPFLNYENTFKSIKTLNNKIKLGKRHISVSTSGHVPGIRQFAKDLPQINLAFSLHSAENEKRNKLVPLNLTYPLEQIAKALRDYINITKRKVFIEYVMIKDLNDASRDARKVVEFLKTIHLKKYFAINLIPYNETSNKFRTSSEENVLKFQKILILNNYETTIRKSVGADIRSACGQLS